MKNKISIWISVFLILAGIVIAIPPNPEIYWGYVYVEGELAPNGSVLSVETVSRELLVNKTLPIDENYPGSYYVEIPFDNIPTQKDEGADAGESLTWKLNNINTLDPRAGEDTAEPAKTNNNFTISAILNPSLTANISSFNQSIILGDLINLTVILNNNGDGTANVTLFNIDGENITTDLPKYLQVAKNNISNASIEVIPEVCKEFNSDLIINYYNLVGDLIDTLTKELSFSVKGYDIEIANLSASNYSVNDGTYITVTAIVSNKGDFDINGFNITFYDNLNDSIINSINTNLTLLSGENTSITFNWQPAAGNNIITAAAAITEDECDNGNNIKNSSEIVVNLESSEEDNDDETSRSSSQGGGGIYSYVPATEILNETANESIEEVIEETENETVSEETETEANLITGMITKEIDYKKTLPQFILMLIIIFGLSSVYYLFKKEKIISTDQKLPVKKKEHKPEEKKEIKPKIEEKKQPVKEEKNLSEKLKIKPRFFSIFKKPIKKTEEKKLSKEEKKIDERVKIRPRSAIFTGPIKKTEEKLPVKEERKIDERVKIRPRSAIFTKPINKKPEVLYKPKIKVNRDAAIVNIGSRIGLFKKREKEEFNIAEEPPRTEKSTLVSYNYLAMAIELIEKITADKQTRDELIRKYGDKYPRFLIDIVGKYVFLNMGFDKKIDVMDELNKLQVLDQDYKYISHNKLEKAIDIIAKGYAMQENS